MIFICRKEDASINEPFDYKEVFAPYMDGYIRLKDSCGFKTLNTKWLFKVFHAYTICLGLKKSVLAQKLINTWSQTIRNDFSRTLSGKYSHLAQLAHYRNEQGVKAYITLLPKCINSIGFVQYI